MRPGHPTDHSLEIARAVRARVDHEQRPARHHGHARSGSVRARHRTARAAQRDVQSVGQIGDRIGGQRAFGARAHHARRDRPARGDSDRAHRGERDHRTECPAHVSSACPLRARAPHYTAAIRPWRCRTMAEPRVVLRNANLIDGSGPPQPGATVVIEGNRIAHAGGEAGAARPGRSRDRSRGQDRDARARAGPLPLGLRSVADVRRGPDPRPRGGAALHGHDRRAQRADRARSAASPA